jgi:segregation and condensation protein B
MMETNEETEETAGENPPPPDAKYQADLFGDVAWEGQNLKPKSEEAASAAAGYDSEKNGETDDEAAGASESGDSFSNDALVEAVLFLESEPIDEKQIARITSLTENDVETALETLKERYKRLACGVELVRIGGGVTVAPKKQYWETLKERYGRKNTAKLSRAAMETLAIIAYSQPITRAEIEAIRGVQADNMIRLLLERGLIRETGKKDIAGHPVQFGTTKEFLSLFRLESIADLPKLNEMEAERFELPE